MVTPHYTESAPTLLGLVESVVSTNPLQKRRIGNLLGEQDGLYFEHAEAISRALVRLGASHSLGPDDLAGAYNTMLGEMRRLQIDFRKTGTYQDNNSDSAIENIYHNPERMLRYMLGLGLSQVLWANHYRIYRFFREIINHDPLPARYLEIGAGHGLYIAAAMEDLPLCEFSVLDISQMALEITSGILQAFGLDPSRTTMTCGDAFDLNEGPKRYDLVIMGEVLEHVKSPANLLAVVGEALTPDGRMFITTCANCPAVDHIYLFHNVAEIRALVMAAGFVVVEEKYWPSEPIPEEEWESEKVAINYAAVIRPLRHDDGN